MKSDSSLIASDRHNRLPILGICGYSGAGKTTLIESLIKMLLQQGLRVAVVKHGAHNVRVDTPGKDSDRFFQTGADVCLLGEEQFSRWHEKKSFSSLLSSLCTNHDLVLVEGHASTPVSKIWLLGRGYDEPPENAGNVLLKIHRRQAQPENIVRFITNWLREKWLQTPVWACVLIGGKSKRMGRPKHLLKNDDHTWLEHTVRKLGTVTDNIVLSGKGQVPVNLSNIIRIPDVQGIGGPLSGILSAMRWNPFVTWLMVACDLPDIDPEALSWLLSTRKPGVWATMPDLDGSGRVEPLLAHYDFRCKGLFEEIGLGQKCRINDIVDHPGVITPQPPAPIRGSWHNVNSPSDLEQIRG